MFLFEISAHSIPLNACILWVLPYELVLQHKCKFACGWYGISEYNSLNIYILTATAAFMSSPFEFHLLYENSPWGCCLNKLVYIDTDSGEKKQHTLEVHAKLIVNFTINDKPEIHTLAIQLLILRTQCLICWHWVPIFVATHQMDGKQASNWQNSH